MNTDLQLDKEEVAVLKACYDYSLKEETNYVTLSEISRELKEAGMSEEDIQDATKILIGRSLIGNYGGTNSSKIHSIRTTVYGFIDYANRYIPELNQIYNGTIDAIVNEGIENHKQIAAHLNQPIMLIDYIFDLLKQNKLINAAKAMGRNADYLITNISPEARKIAKKLKAEKNAKTSEDSIDSNVIAQKEEKRNRVLVRMYLESNGNPYYAVPDEVVSVKENIPAEELKNEIQPYLVNERYIKHMTFTTTAIDHRGIKKVEDQLQKKNQQDRPEVIPIPISVKGPEESMSEENRSNTLFIPNEGQYPLIKSLIGYKEDIERKLKQFPFEKNVFLMMKYRDSNKDLSDFIIERLEVHGLNGVRADQPQWNITRNVYNPLAVLYCCKYGIALFDEPEETQLYSPNVAYELGIMHYQKKDCLILKHASIKDVFFDLIKDLYKTYDKDLKVKVIIKNWIEEISS